VVHFQRFGKYEITRKLSRSMTDVYLACDTVLNRPVVLKIIEYSRDDFTQLVLAAERRGSLLQKQLHDIDPRILQIYDFGEQNNCFFVAMQYFEGRTLAEILQVERRFEAKRAARYAAEICSQLRTLHSFVSDVDGRKKAVVHGDIKPSNVQIGLDDELRLLDFGIAKVITFTHNLTHHNLGSPSYCSPERISKSQVDQQADLWAVGVSLYEMIAGMPPYQAESTRKLENLIQSRHPPHELPPDCPAPIKAIVSKALAADLERRYDSAEAFEGDLRAFIEGRPTVAEREPQTGWDANPTVQTDAKPTVATARQNGTRRAAVRIKKPSNSVTNVAIALLAGILAGFLIFIPIGSYYRAWRETSHLRTHRDYAHASVQSINSDWNSYRELKQKHGLLGPFSPVAGLDTAMHANLVGAADNILATFRNSSDAQLRDFDWAKARLCLRYAHEIDPSDAKAKAELALSEGYLNLAQNPKLPKAGLSVGSFKQAESYLPGSPDPHLALARIYVYAYHNVAQAVAELQKAEQLGYKLGNRENQEEGDGYLYRAEWALAHAKQTSVKVERGKWLQASRADMDRARGLYEPIVGFSNVSKNLDQLQQDSVEQAKLEMENGGLAAARARLAQFFSNLRRWR
jgi:serine/threonine protein kinase